MEADLMRSHAPLLITSIRAQRVCRKPSSPTLLLGAVSLSSSLVNTPSLGLTSCSQTKGLTAT